MEALEHAWKPCDLRGSYPHAVSEDLFRRVGAALGSEMARASHAVVGGDFRLSTPALKGALIEGLVSTGVHVLDCGQAPTPIHYFQAARLKADAVFIVTASHNPAADNGLKWMIGGLPPTPDDMDRIRLASEAGTFRSGVGSVQISDPLPAYREWITWRWRSLAAEGVGPIILDAGNGAWADLAPEIFEDLGLRVISLHGGPDGRFPNRPADCARTGNLSALRRAVLDHGATLGIAWDGDGDRVAFVAEDGVHASTDEISILFARDVLASPDAGSIQSENVICDIKLSDAVRREVLAFGGVPLLERSGHAFMRSRLLGNRAILGLDACGHYFFREAGSRDDGLYSALFLLNMLDGTRTLKQLRTAVTPIFSTPELRVRAALLGFPIVRERLRAAFSNAQESSIDGMRLLLQDGVVLVRESSTEPVISMRLEGFSEGSFGRIVEQTLAVLPEAEAILRTQIEGRH